MNYRIKIQYEGTRYSGWQRNGGKETVQGKIETVLSRLFGHKIEINGAGRTDAGVHALGQTANFKVNSGKTKEEILTYLNKYLPEDISVTQIHEADDRFHSRLCAKEKIYCYRIHNSDISNVFTRRFVYKLPQPLDVEKMRKAAEYFKGEHNFSAFCGNRHFKKSPVRKIYSADVEKSGSEIVLTFRGSGFLYNMVRIMTGTLIEVGMGKREAEEIPQIIASENRERAGETAPAKGLMLIDVIYPPDIR